MNIIITGANTGIGYETAKGLYRDGNHIIFGSRNQQKNIQAVKSIIASFPESKGSIRSFQLDLSQRKSIEQFSQKINTSFTHIDILINNAGIIKTERQLNELKIEMTMAVNHFGPFYLTYLLFPLIKKAKEARIINVSSRVHLYTSDSPSQDLDATRSWGSMSLYQRSKLANVLFTVGLADRLSNNPSIRVASLHPGIVDSDFGTGSCLISFFKCCCCCMYVSNQAGATTSLHLARLPFEKIKTGQYYDNDTQIVPKNVVAENKVEVNKLWQVSEKAYGITFQV